MVPGSGTAVAANVSVLAQVAAPLPLGRDPFALRNFDSRIVEVELAAVRVTPALAAATPFCLVLLSMLFAEATRGMDATAAITASNFRDFMTSWAPPHGLLTLNRLLAKEFRLRVVARGSYDFSCYSKIR